MPADSKRSPARTPVSTILTPLERSHVDAAANGVCDALHRESLDEVLSDLREQRANLVLISVNRYGSQNSSRVAAMVREFPRVPAVALLTETQSSTPHTTLALGQLGIRTLVDARMPAGWQTLRNLLAAQGSTDLQRSALAQISLDLSGVSKDCWRFFELLFDSTPRISTVRQLARHLNILPSKAPRAKTLPVTRQAGTCGTPVRESRIISGPCCQSSGLFFTAKFWTACTHGDEDVTCEVQEYFRWSGNASVLQNGACPSLCRCTPRIPAIGCLSWMDS